MGPLPVDIWGVLRYAHEQGGIALQGDTARLYALPLSLAASLGWITTILPGGQSYGPRWYITTSGLTALDNKEHFTS